MSFLMRVSFLGHIMLREQVMSSTTSPNLGNWRCRSKSGNDEPRRRFSPFGTPNTSGSVSTVGSVGASCTMHRDRNNLWIFLLLSLVRSYCENAGRAACLSKK